MNWDLEDLNKVVDLSEKDIISGRDESKWITFNCEYCGEEKEQLISRYNKNKRHCCSDKCRTTITINRIEVNCSYCNEIIKKKPSTITNTQQHFFCNITTKRN